MQLFYSPDISEGSTILDEEESRHCIRVLRLKIEDEIKVTDGKGNIFLAEIISDNPKKCQLKVLEKQIQSKRTYHIHIAIAPPKNISRFEWFLEKVTEIGIDEITPLICERSERTKLNMERLKKISIETIKQCLQPYLPKLNEPKKFIEFVTSPIAFRGRAVQKFIPHCSANLIEHLQLTYERGKDALILIGPEGDFSEKEIELAHQNNFQSASLGTNRLRVETAGIAACHTIHLSNL